ncbi:MAG: hypothetical protein FJ280_09900 [Planctomycetes bacterium]|nr:hypothetical protein [Planctomycetota bacterium]
MKIAVECYPDEAVLRALGIPRKQLLHEARKGEVFNWLKKNAGGVGIVDEDPDSAQPRDLISYQQVHAAEGLLLLVRQGGSGQRLIVVRPRLEDWLIHRACICGVDLRRYQLPDSSKELHAVPRYEQRDGFRRFLADLSGCDKGMSLLRQWVLQR